MKTFAFASKFALAIGAAAALFAVSAVSAAEARCARCKPAAKTIHKTQYKYSTVRQVRNVTRYRDVYRIHYFVKRTKLVSRAEFERFRRSCKQACVLAR